MFHRTNDLYTEWLPLCFNSILRTDCSICCSLLGSGFAQEELERNQTILWWDLWRSWSVSFKMAVFSTKPISPHSFAHVTRQKSQFNDGLSLVWLPAGCGCKDQPPDEMSHIAAPVARPTGRRVWIWFKGGAEGKVIAASKQIWECQIQENWISAWVRKETSHRTVDWCEQSFSLTVHGISIVV